ncbi:MAG: hypothetical protein KGZ65_03545 [Sphingomonadales bacterium]|nr:hypothetical protein [Sphingomonadaceae bacterium]MBS3930284.1 hypothetical protein [Sphingomonadales bacterium]
MSERNRLIVFNTVGVLVTIAAAVLFYKLVTNRVPPDLARNLAAEAEIFNQQRTSIEVSEDIAVGLAEVDGSKFIVNILVLRGSLGAAEVLDAMKPNVCGLILQGGNADANRATFVFRIHNEEADQKTDVAINRVDCLNSGYRPVTG